MYISDCCWFYNTFPKEYVSCSFEDDEHVVARINGSKIN